MRTCVEVKPKVSPEAIEAALNETEENRPVITPSLGTTRDQERNGLALLTGKKWQNGRTIKVWFDKAGTGVVDRCWPYFLEWTKYANIKFERVTDRNLSDVRAGFVEGDGSWSYLGPDCLTIPKNQHTMNFGWLTPDESEEEFKRVVLHEVGHMLGAVHEHSSPAGGIPWDREAVLKYYQGPPNYWSVEDIEGNVFYRYSESQTNFTEFDRLSIMAYPVPNELTIGDYFVPFNTQLSEQDKKFIAWYYPKPQQPPQPTLPTKTINKFMVEGVTERTGILKNKQKFAIAEPWK